MRNVIFQIGNKKFADFKQIDDSHLRLFSNGKTNGKDAVFELDFYRLIPTKTRLKKENIEKLTYSFKENGEFNTELTFNKELMDLEVLKRFHFSSYLYKLPTTKQ